MDTEGKRTNLTKNNNHKCKECKDKKKKQPVAPIAPILKKDEELGYLGPIKIVIFNPKNGCDCKIFFGFWTCLCHLLIGVTVFMTIKPILIKLLNNPSTITVYDMHIILCCIGYQLLIAEAILCLNHYNGCVPPLSERHKKLGHYILVIIGSIIALIGTLLGLINENFELKSWHAIFGALAGCFIIGGLLNGICASKMKRCLTFWKLFHSSFGLPAFVLSSVSLIYVLIQKPDNIYAIKTLEETDFENTTLGSTIYDNNNTSLGSTHYENTTFGSTINDITNYGSTLFDNTTSGSTVYDTTIDNTANTTIGNTFKKTTFENTDITKNLEVTTIDTTTLPIVTTEYFKVTTIIHIITPTSKISYTISYLLAVCCCLYTIGIAGMPIVNICKSWLDEIF